MALNKNSLKAAVKRLADLKGKSEQEVREAIAGDDKGFSREDQDEIYLAFLAETGDAGEGEGEGEGDSQTPAVYVVAEGCSFRDIGDYSQVWNSRDDVSHFAPDRIKSLLEQKLIEKK